MIKSIGEVEIITNLIIELGILQAKLKRGVTYHEQLKASEQIKSIIDRLKAL